MKQARGVLLGVLLARLIIRPIENFGEDAAQAADQIGKLSQNVESATSRVALQAGTGFVHADFHRDDTSWLVSIGVRLDDAVTQSLSLTTAFLLNFIDLATEPQPALP